MIESCRIFDSFGGAVTALIVLDVIAHVGHAFTAHFLGHRLDFDDARFDATPVFE